MARTAITFFCNSDMLAGLALALRSLALNLPEPDRQPIFVFHQLSHTQIEALRKFLGASLAHVEFRPIAMSNWQDLPSLHGDRMTYGRLALPSLLPGVDRALYLDADTWVLGGISHLLDFDLAGSPLASVKRGQLRWSNDWALLSSLGLSDRTPYFNAGVLLFDLRLWRERALTEECLAFLRKHRAQVRTVDQTALNALFWKNSADLPQAFNQELYPQNPRKDLLELNQGILHFIGSPKPWDILGLRLNLNSYVVADHLREFRQHWARSSSIRRSLRLSRSYWRALRAVVR